MSFPIRPMVRGGIPTKTRDGLRRSRKLRMSLPRSVCRVFFGAGRLASGKQLAAKVMAVCEADRLQIPNSVTTP